jgi:hypothetical protein
MKSIKLIAFAFCICSFAVGDASAQAVKKAPSISLLDPKERDEWQVTSGHWGFGANLLTGHGDCSIEFQREVLLPFQLKFDVVIRNGAHPRISLDRYSYTEAGDETYVDLPPLRYWDTNHVEHERKYSVQLNAADGKVSTWIDGKLYHTQKMRIRAAPRLIFAVFSIWSNEVRNQSVDFCNITLIRK